jgi:hypothetical protein
MLIGVYYDTYSRRRKPKIAGAHFSMAAGITMVLRAVKSSLAVRMKTAM